MSCHWIALLVLLGGAAPALAHEDWAHEDGAATDGVDTDGKTDGKTGGKQEGGPPDQAAATPPEQKVATPGPKSEESAGYLERMPASAFPEPRVRGIKGGSLWMSFHGLQWPYFPRTGIGISAYAWVDSGYEKIDRGNPSEQNIDYWL